MKDWYDYMMVSDEIIGIRYFKHLVDTHGYTTPEQLFEDYKKEREENEKRNNSHLYLIGDFVITHNSSFQAVEEFGFFPNYLDFYQTTLPNVQEGQAAAGQSYSIGCVCLGGEDKGSRTAASNRVVCYNEVLDINLSTVRDVKGELSSPLSNNSKVLITSRTDLEKRT